MIKNILKNFEVLNIEKIEEGFNENYKVTTTNKIIFVKIFKNKSYEMRDWIKGQTIKVWSKKNLKLIAKSIYFFHNKQKDKDTKHIKIFNYFKFGKVNNKYDNLINKYSDTLIDYCHCDINKNNVVKTKNKIKLIDFEFARMNNKYWDIANLFNEECFTLSQQNIFKRHYKNINNDMLNDFLFINKTFNKLWKKKNWKK